MKVEGPLTPRVGSVRRKSGTDASGSSFADALDEESAAGASGAAPLSGAAATTSVDALLALQAAEGEEGDAAKERAKRHGENLLNQLDALRMDLLMGGIPRQRLMTMAQTVKAARETTFDPRLNDLIDEIDLRAQVELAKYDPYR